MKITDMNLFCLEESFKNLELGDLLNVADASIALRKAAEFVYFRKYSEITIVFQQLRSGENTRSYKFNKENLYIDDSKTALQLLRCFGHMIKYIKIYDNHKFFFIQLNEYCAETLVKIEFYCVNEDNFRLLTKQFTKVQQVEINNWCITKMGWLRRKFPKMQQFKCYADYYPDKKKFLVLIRYRYGLDNLVKGIKRVKKFYYNTLDLQHIKRIRFMVDHFPHLEQFEFIICKKHFPISAKEQLLKFLRLNPQLKKLGLTIHTSKIESVSDFDTFQDIIEPMHNLEELTLTGNIVPHSTEKKIHFKNIKRFEIRCRSTQLKLPFLFDRLEFFSVKYIQLTDDVYDFIEQHSTIKTLVFDNYYFDGPNVDFTRLITAIPLLNEITVYYENVMSVNDILELISSFKLLKTFCFFVPYKQDIFQNKLRARLGDQWRISTKPHPIYSDSLFYLERSDNRTS